MLILILRVSQTIAASLRTRRGKSELHRAGCWITSSGGDSKDSATEINRLDLSRYGWKGEVRAHQGIGDYTAM